MTTPVGFVGLGRIGRPMALRLVDRPGGLWVHDVDPRAVAPLADAGAQVAASPAELAEHAELVSIMVRDDEQVREVVGELLTTAREGAVLAIHSTIAPDTARALAEQARPHGVAVLDAPVSGGAPGAQSGRLAVLVGGEPEAFDAAREYLGRLGDLVVHVGGVGAGTAAKLARNLVHFVGFAAAGEAARLAEAAGLDLRTLGAVVRHTDAVTGGPGALLHRDTAGGVPVDDPWYPILDHVRALGDKDLSLALGLADSIGVDLPLTRLASSRLGAELGLDPSDSKDC